MKLSDLIGTSILAWIPQLHPTDYVTVKLHGVEAGGIWIESQDATNAFLQAAGRVSTVKTPAFFVPYHGIIVMIRTIDSPALDEKAFGL